MANSARYSATGLPICVVVGQLSKDERRQFEDALSLQGALQVIDPKSKTKLTKNLLSKGFKQESDKTTYYVCKDFTCQKATTDINNALSLLKI